MTRLQSEEGSVILFVMVLILVLSIYGINSLKSSSSELMISRNHRCYKQNMYQAEAVVMEAASVLDNETEPETKLKPETAEDWLADGTTDPVEFAPETGEWSTGNNAKKSEVIEDGDTSYVVVFEGLAPGASLSMGGSQLWQYGVYGKSQLCEGEVGVVAGFRKRF